MLGKNNNADIFCFRHDSTEMDHSENEDITLKRSDSTDKVLRPRVYSSNISCGDRLIVIFQQWSFDCVSSQSKAAWFQAL